MSDASGTAPTLVGPEEPLEARQARADWCELHAVRQLESLAHLRATAKRMRTDNTRPTLQDLTEALDDAEWFEKARTQLKEHWATTGELLVISAPKAGK